MGLNGDLGNGIALGLQTSQSLLMGGREERLLPLRTLDKGTIFYLFISILTLDVLSRLVLLGGDKVVVEGFEEGKESIHSTHL